VEGGGRGERGSSETHSRLSANLPPVSRSRARASLPKCGRGGEAGGGEAAGCSPLYQNPNFCALRLRSAGEIKKNSCRGILIARHAWNAPLRAREATRGLPPRAGMIPGGSGSWTTDWRSRERWMKNSNRPRVAFPHDAALGDTTTYIYLYIFMSTWTFFPRSGSAISSVQSSKFMQLETVIAAL